MAKRIKHVMCLAAKEASNLGASIEPRKPQPHQAQLLPRFPPLPSIAMLKVVSRAARAKNQAHKVLTRFNKKKESLRLKDDMRQEKNRLRALAAEAQASRKETKEDRMLGPLAPRRALTMEEVEGYGAVAQERIATEYVPKDKRIRYWNIVINDRVVVLKGQDRHKIGVVKAVDKKRNEVVVGGMNKVHIHEHTYRRFRFEKSYLLLYFPVYKGSSKNPREFPPTGGAPRNVS